MTRQGRKTATRPSTALVRRQPSRTRALLPARKPSKTAIVLAKDINRLETLRDLDDSIQLGGYGQFEVKLTKAEEAVLAERAPIEEIRVLPTGAIYLPHIVYSRWLNRAFGRTGWVLRPVSKPLINDRSVVVPYLLLVHGKPIAYAVGEQEYFANNRDQSYGDALESTVASGLRRCCKRLSLALELWDRSFSDRFLETDCVRVKTEGARDGKAVTKWVWRRKCDSPFWNEVKTGRHPVEKTEIQDEAQPVKPAAHDTKAESPITAEQVRRFWTISRRRGRSDDEVKAYLAARRITSSREIRRKDYETICAAIEHPGPLSVGPGREPGEDG